MVFTTSGIGPQFSLKDNKNARKPRDIQLCCKIRSQDEWYLSLRVVLQISFFKDSELCSSERKRDAFALLFIMPVQ